METYSQDDVTNLARVFTGYDWDYLSNGGTSTPRLVGKEPDTEHASRHQPHAFQLATIIPASEVNFLGTKITGTTPGADALHIALDRLFYHDNTGPFFARQMIQRLVTSNPTPAYVQRVATVFGNNGSGVRGDLKAVWTAILTDEEARAMPTAADTLFGKMREPIVRFVQWARTAEVASRQRRVRDRRSFGARHDARPEPAAVAFGVQLLPARIRATEHGHRHRWQGRARVPVAQ